MSWRDDHTLEVTLGDELRLADRARGDSRDPDDDGDGRALPEAGWNSNAVLAAMGPMARTMLRTGRIRLRGATPNGPRFKAAPLKIWRVVGAAASYHGEDLGGPAPLDTQTHLADFWLPQRGVFFVGRARFTPPDEHVDRRTSTAHKAGTQNGAMTAPVPLPRRVEVLAGLSVAIDLGLGQPAEHMLRSSVIACGLADRLGLSREQRATVYYTTLLMWIGCHADSQEYARWFGDDISVRRDAYLVDWSGLPYLRFLLGNVARGEPLGQRVRVMATLMRDARGQLGNLIHSHCTSAAALARHIGLGPEVERTLAYTFERYDGGGLPAGASGEDIPIEMRVAQLADVAEVHERMYGVQGAVAMARSRRGGQLDPAVVDAFTLDAEALFPAPATTHGTERCRSPPTPRPGWTSPASTTC